MLQSDVHRASERFFQALNAVLLGNPGPMAEIWSHAPDVTNQGPFGERQVGWTSVRAQYEREAALRAGGRVSCEELLIRIGSDMAFTVCVERGEPPPGDDRRPVRYRTTNVFRREDGMWKLMHHHADPMPVVAAEQTHAPEAAHGVGARPGGEASRGARRQARGGPTSPP